MAINDVDGPLTQWRRPRLRLLADGQEAKGVIEVNVSSNNFYSADRFSAEVAISADPSMDFGWWDNRPTIVIKVQIAFLPVGAAEGSIQDWQTVFSGEVDHMQLELQENLLRIDGRDLTARLIEARTQETFVNNTASEVVTILAGRHGLKAEVTATSTRVGQYYAAEHDKLTLNDFSHQTTEWDLLTYLAQNEGFDVFVEDETLHFQPRADGNSDPYVIPYLPGGKELASSTMTVTAIRLERSLTLAKDIEVTVKTWNAKKKKSFTRVVKAQGANTPGAQKQPVQNYVFVRPNLSPDDALKFANSMIAELTKHERVVNITMPGELTLTPRSMIKLEGTSSSFDQAYYIDTIDRTMSFNGGFIQRIRAKNTSPRSQTTVL